MRRLRGKMRLGRVGGRATRSSNLVFWLGQFCTRLTVVDTAGWRKRLKLEWEVQAPPLQVLPHVAVAIVLSPESRAMPDLGQIPAYT